MNYYTIITSFISIIFLIFASVDIYHWFVNRFSRYKIGRWSNDKTWIKKVFITSKKWLPNPPTVPISDNNNLILLDILKGKRKRKTVQSWQTAGLILGITEYDSSNNKKFIEAVNYYINNQGMWRVKPTHIDNALLSYSFLKNYPDKEFLKPAMDYMIAVIKNFKCSDGMIAYSNRKNLRYVDTLGMICPFLILYSKIYGTPEYAKLSINQITLYNKNGLYKNSFLPSHAFETKHNLPMGVFGWGRGCGWYILGIIDSYLELNDSKMKEKLRKNILEIAEYYSSFQRNDGGFGVFLQDENTYDSSATAIFSYFYFHCYLISKKSQFKDIGVRCLDILKRNTRKSGVLDHCQGDTKDVGIFSMRYDRMPFAQGLTLRAYSLYKQITQSY